MKKHYNNPELILENLSDVIVMSGADPMADSDNIGNLSDWTNNNNQL